MINSLLSFTFDATKTFNSAVRSDPGADLIIAPIYRVGLALERWRSTQIGARIQRQTQTGTFSIHDHPLRLTRTCAGSLLPASLAPSNHCSHASMYPTSRASTVRCRSKRGFSDGFAPADGEARRAEHSCHVCFDLFPDCYKWASSKKSKFHAQLQVSVG